MSRIDRLLHRAWENIGAGQEQQMEVRLYRILCLLGAIFSFFVIIPANCLQHLPQLVNGTVFLFGTGCCLLYRRSRRGRSHFSLLFVLLLAGLNTIWFCNGGSAGSIPYYFFPAFLYPLIFFRGKSRWIMLAVAIGNVVGLIGAELSFPHLVVPFRDNHDRIIDLAVNIVVTALTCAFMFWAVVANYDRERTRLQQANLELQRHFSELKQVEETLRKNQELLNAVVSSTPDAIFVKDRESRYVLFNNASAAITGRSAEEVIGNDDTFIFPAELARSMMDADRLVVATGKPITSENTLITAEGKKRHQMVTKGPLTDTDGNIIGIFGISHDITERKEAAEAICSLYNELDLRVQERTAQLEAAVHELETFSYSVSHDLRSPLRHINSYTAILAEEFGNSFPAEAHQYFDRIRTASRNMGNLIDDLLEMSRVTRAEMTRELVDLGEMANDIMACLQETNPGREVEVAIGDGLTANGDRMLVRLALENLLNNAWKYSARRNPARIEMGKEMVDGKCYFFVRDNGIGFDMRYEEKIFAPFQRLHGAEYEGTGIGLATVKRIIERHGGDLIAQSAVDRGATFFFSLP